MSLKADGIEHIKCSFLSLHTLWYIWNNQSYFRFSQDTRLFILTDFALTTQCGVVNESVLGPAMQYNETAGLSKKKLWPQLFQIKCVCGWSSVIEQKVYMKSPNWSEPTSPIHILKKSVSDHVNGRQWSYSVLIKSVFGPVMKQQVYL